MINLPEHIPYSNRMREFRSMMGLTQLQVAKLMGFVSDDRICHWERGTAVPHLVNLFKLQHLPYYSRSAILGTGAAA
jgi:transcriptional regulator with XRE-family HTH domain